MSEKPQAEEAEVETPVEGAAEPAVEDWAEEASAAIAAEEAERGAKAAKKPVESGTPRRLSGEPEAAEAGAEPEAGDASAAEPTAEPAVEEEAEPEVADPPVAVVAEPEPAAPEVEASAEPKESFGGSLAGELPAPRIKLLTNLAAIVLSLDLITKVVAVAVLEKGEPIQLFGGALYLTFVRNPGAAFGLAEGMTWVLALISLGVAGFILWISRNLRSLGWAIGLGLVLGGAVGNLVDRIFRAPGPMRGHVVDFLSLFDPFGRVWPVFNVADMAIVIGGSLIVFMALRQHDYDGTVHKEKVAA